MKLNDYLNPNTGDEETTDVDPITSKILNSDTKDFDTSITRQNWGQYDAPKSKYLSGLENPLTTVKEGGIRQIMSERQPLSDKVFRGTIRAQAAFVKSLLDIPGIAIGAAYGLANLGREDHNFMTDFLDNGYMRMLDKAKTYLDEEVIPVYMDPRVQEGNLGDMMKDASWWASEGADAFGFILSLFAPGAIAKGLKIGSRVMKGVVNVEEARKAIQLGEGIEGASTLARTPEEAARVTRKIERLNRLAEKGLPTSVERIDQYVGSMADAGFQAVGESISSGQLLEANAEEKYQSGEIDREEYDRLISKKGDVMARTFSINFPILLGPNAVRYGLTFGAPKNAARKAVIDASGKLQRESEVLSTGLGKPIANRVKSGKNKVTNFLNKRLGTKIKSSTLSEADNVRNISWGALGRSAGIWGESALKSGVRVGLYEIGMQQASSTYYGENPDKNFLSFFPNMADAYLDMIKTTDGQKGIFLGFVMGTAMEAPMRHFREKSDIRRFNKLVDDINTTNQGFFDAWNGDIYERISEGDRAGEIIYEEDSKGNKTPKIKEEVLKQNIASLAHIGNLGRYYEAYAKLGDEVGLDLIRNEALRDFIMPFVQDSKLGLSVLEQHLQNLGPIEDYAESVNKSKESVIKDIMDQAKAMEKAVNTFRNFGDVIFNIKADNATMKDYRGFYNVLQNRFTRIKDQKVLANRKVAELTNELNDQLNDLNIDPERFNTDEAYRKEILDNNVILDDLYHRNKSYETILNDLGREEADFWNVKKYRKLFKDSIEYRERLQEAEEGKNQEETAQVQEEIDKAKKASEVESAIDKYLKNIPEKALNRQKFESRILQEVNSSLKKDLSPANINKQIDKLVNTNFEFHNKENVGNLISDLEKLSNDLDEALTDLVSGNKKAVSKIKDAIKKRLNQKDEKPVRNQYVEAKAKDKLKKLKEEKKAKEVKEQNEERVESEKVNNKNISNETPNDLGNKLFNKYNPNETIPLTKKDLTPFLTETELDQLNGEITGKYKGVESNGKYLLSISNNGKKVAAIELPTTNVTKPVDKVDSNYSTETSGNTNQPSHKSTYSNGGVNQAEPSNGARVMSVYSTDSNRGQLIDFASNIEWVNELERGGFDLTGKEVHFELRDEALNKNLGKYDEAAKLFREALGGKMLSNTEIDFLANNLSLNVVVEHNGKTYKSALEGPKSNTFNATKPLIESLINHAISNGEIDSFTTTIQGQYNGEIAVDPNPTRGEAKVNNIMDLWQFTNPLRNMSEKAKWKYINDNLLYVVGTGTLIRAKDNEIVKHSNASNLAPGEFYLMIDRPGGTKFPLKLNNEKLSQIEANTIADLYLLVVNNPDVSTDFSISDLKEINNSLFNTINENFSKVKNVIDGSKSPSWSNISINNLLDFFIHTSSGNPKSTIGFEAGENGAFSFIYGDGLNNGGRIDVSTEGEINGKTAKSDLVNWLTNNKRHNLNVKPKQGQPESITTRNPAYIRYLIENNILNTNAKVNEPTFQDYTSIYLDTNVSTEVENTITESKENVSSPLSSKARETLREDSEKKVPTPTETKKEPTLDELLSRMTPVDKSTTEVEPTVDELLAKLPKEGSTITTNTEILEKTGKKPSVSPKKELSLQVMNDLLKDLGINKDANSLTVTELAMLSRKVRTGPKGLDTRVRDIIKSDLSNSEKTKKLLEIHEDNKRNESDNIKECD